MNKATYDVIGPPVDRLPLVVFYALRKQVKLVFINKCEFMRNIRLFSEHSDYEAYISQEDAILPNVSYCLDTPNEVHYNPYVEPIQLLRYLYSDLTASKDYDSSKTVIGLEIIPSSHTPDHVARYMALTQVGNTDGSSGDTQLTWSNNSGTTLLTQQYTQVPTITSGSVETVNYGTFQDMKNIGNLPSTNENGSFSGLTNTRGERYFTDANKNYLTPSLYGEAGDRNPICDTSSTTNALTDFSGYGNTQALMAASTGSITVPAATAAWNYASKNGLTGVQSYLPAAGELAYIVPNFKRIQDVLASLGSKATILPSSNPFWSSSERSASSGWTVHTDGGSVHNYNKTYSYYVRPFLKITA